MTKKSLTAALAVVAVLTLSPTSNAADTAAARLEKLEDAVRALQKENDSLKAAIHGEVAREVAAAPAGKISISAPVSELRLYGEGRIRYFINEGIAAGRDAGDGGDRERFRYRLRLGADIKV